MKKKISSIALVAATFILPNISVAYNYSWCANKIANLEKQMGYAQSYGNHNRIRGLERALHNVYLKCGESHHDVEVPYYEEFNGDKNASDKQRDYHLRDKILNQKEKVLEAEYELKKAKLQGKLEKVAEKELKLEKRKAKLRLYEEELNRL